LILCCFFAFVVPNCETRVKRLKETPNSDSRAFFAIYEPTLSYEAALDKFLDQISYRISLSCNQMNICSMLGIKRFAETSKLSDYILGFPILTRDQTRL